MKTPAVAPYLLPPAESVLCQAWTASDGEPLPNRLDHWDPFTNVEAFRSVEVDVGSVQSACGLEPDATFALVASWTSSRTRLSGSGLPVELGPQSGLVRVGLALQMPGAQLGGRLDLHTRLVLRYAGASPSLISPRREGAMLWQEQNRIDVEGAAARFPITAVDFAAVPRLPEGGAWAFEWTAEELESPVLGGLRLIINSSNETLLGALRSGSTDPRSTVTRSFVMFDVARTLVQGALHNERFVNDPETFDDGTTGRMLFELLANCWPGVSVGVLRTRSTEDPSRIEAELQAHLGMFA